MRDISPLVAPKSIAVIGASTDPSKSGGVLFANLAAGNLDGTLYPINPRADSVMGIKAFPEIAAVPGQCSHDASGEGFILSLLPDFSTDDRLFTVTDTLHMLVWTDAVDFTDLGEASWTLSHGGSSLDGSLGTGASLSTSSVMPRLLFARMRLSKPPMISRSFPYCLR